MDRCVSQCPIPAPSSEDLLGLVGLGTALFGLINLDDLLLAAAITIVHGTDDLAIYPPVFAVHTAAEIVVLVAAFLVMTAFWCLLAYRVVAHPALGRLHRRDGQRLMPFVLFGHGLDMLVAT